MRFPSPYRFMPVSLVVLSMILLSACQEGGSDAGASGGTAPAPVSNTYQISGTVQGLQGTGLVLNLNENEQLSVTGNGAFHFQSVLGNGTPYSVKVQRQPASPVQHCTAQAGSGRVGPGTASTVEVQCRNLHQINVEVSGFQGGQAVLHSSLGDDLTITGDGFYTFPTRVAEGSAYEISVGDYPQSPVQYCEIQQVETVASARTSTSATPVVCEISFYVGGIVRDLTGKNLILRNNGGDELALSESGAFHFFTPMPNGASYEVSVAAQPGTEFQPRNQTCVVSNSTGVMNGSHVESVTIDCIDDVAPSVLSVTPGDGDTGVDRFHPLTISYDEPILATSVTAQSIKITRTDGSVIDGRFSFAEDNRTISFIPTPSLEMLNEYRFSIDDTITDLAGHGSGMSYSGNFFTRDGEWSTPMRVDGQDSQVLDPAVAMSAYDSAITVWRQHDGSLFNIQGSSLASGDEWAAPFYLENSDQGTAWEPEIAMDAAGNAVVAWSQHSGVRENIWVNYYQVDRGWSGATLLEQNNTGGTATDPQIAMNDSGQAVVVWREFNGTVENLWSSHFSPDSGWSLPVLVEFNIGSARNATIDIDSAGNAITVWQQMEGDVYSIWASRFDRATHTWEAPVSLEAMPGSAYVPRVSMNGQGGAITVWQQESNGQQSIYAAHYSNGNWGAPVLLEQLVSGDALNPVIAHDDGGRAITVWRIHENGIYNLYANHYDPIAGWSAPLQLEVTDTGSVGEPKLAMNGSGDALVVWAQNDGTRYNIHANRYQSETGWQGAQLLEEDNAGNAMDPRVAIDRQGNGVAVWRQNDGVRDWLNSARFD